MRKTMRRYWPWGAAGLTVFAIPVTLWLFRIPIAEMAVRQVCDGRNVSCSVNIEALTLNSIHASGVKVEAEGEDPATVESLELSVSWPAFLKPQISFVRADTPSLTVDARNGGVRIGLLEQLQTGSSGDGGGEIPPFSITDGKLIILTDAGRVKGVVSSSGSIQREIQSQIVLEPANLQLEGYELDLAAANAQIVLADGRMSGDATLDVTRAELENLTIDALGLELKLEPVSDQDYKLNWSFGATQFELGDFRLSAADSLGDVTLRTDPDRLSVDTTEILSIEGTLNAGALRNGGQSLTDPKLTLALTPNKHGLSGPVGFEAGVMADGLARFERALLTGDLSLDSRKPVLSSGQFSGALGLRGGSLDPGFLDAQLSVLSLPDPVSDHGALIRESLRKLFFGFSTGAEFEAQFAPDAPSFAVTAIRPVSVQSLASEQTLSLRPVGDTNWLAFDGNQLRVSGALQYNNPATQLGLSAARLNVDGNLDQNTYSILASDLRLNDVKTAGRTLGVDLKSLDYRSVPSQKSLTLSGMARFSGPAFGMDLEALQLQTRLTGRDVGEGWSINLAQNECLNLSFISADLPAVQLGPANTMLCASPNVGLYSPTSGGFRGQARADALSLPFETSFAEGRLQATGLRYSWAMRDQFSLSLSGGGLDIPFTVSADEPANEKTANLVAKAFSSGLSTQSSGIAVEFGLEDGDFSLEALPVDLALAEVNGQGEVADDGPQIDYSILGAVITDALNPPENAFFSPLLFSGTGQLTGMEVGLEGRLRLADQNAFLGDLSARHVFESNSGTARLANGNLTFSPNGLQLHDLTERMRGLAVRAEGDVSPSADVSWQDGVMASEGMIDIRDLSFSTFRLGDVYRLSGQLAFSDLLGAQTYASQKLQVEELRFTPTIVLRDGELTMSLLGPDAFYLESAAWPFVGGEVAIEPTVWRFDSQQQRVTVTAKEWELSRLLGLFQVPDLDVRGRVSGEFPIEIIDANAYFRNARLRGVEDGLIRYDSKIARTAGQADDYAKMAFDALKNFEYKVLSVGANGNLTGDIVLELSLSGNNPDVLDGQVFNLNINLDSRLADLVHAGSISTSVQSAQDLVVDLVKKRREEENQVDQSD